MYDAILKAGAPGVSTNFGVMIDTRIRRMGSIKTKNGLWCIPLSVQIVSIQSESPFKQKLKSLELTDLLSTPYQFRKLLHIWVANSQGILLRLSLGPFTGEDRTLKLYLET